MRYFISYENLINNSELDKDITIHSEELKLVHKKKNGEYLIEPLVNFTSNKLELDSFIKSVEEKRKNITFMVELTSEEAKKVHPIFLKRFKDNKLLNEDKYIKLLDKDVITFMDYKEVISGRHIYLNSINNNEFNLSITKPDKSIYEYNIGEGEYFYTEVERTLEKYSDKIIEIENIDKNKYKLHRHKLLVIDSIGKDRVIGLGRETYAFLYRVCFESKPVYIEEDDNNYKIYTSVENNTKKAYILENQNLSNIIYDSAVQPLFKYINIYELEDGVYKKTPLQTYIKEYKYTKKPSNN